MNQQVLVFRDIRDAYFQERSLDELEPDEFRVRTTHSLISPGTELALYHKNHIGFDDPEITWCRYPIDIGYSSVGVVTESRNPDVTVGARIAHYGPHANVVTIGPTGPVWARVPDGLPSPSACFGRFAQIAYSSVIAALRPVHHALVYGAGIVGNLAAQWFQDLGADTTVSDLSQRRLEIAQACGIRSTEIAGESTAGTGSFDTIIEATGVAPVIGEALERVAVGGQVVLLGSIRKDVTINAYKHIHRKAVILSGAHETIIGPDRTPVLARSLEALSAGRLVADAIVTKTIDPEELPGMYERIEGDPDEYFGVVVAWDSEPGNGSGQ